MSISFTPLWETMKSKGYTTYDLKMKLKIGGGTYNRLKNNQSVSTHTIDMLCDYLDCEVQKIMCWERTPVKHKPPKLKPLRPIKKTT